MASRMQLHEILCRDVLESKNCYFRPPTGKKMNYPCIIYDTEGWDVDYADNQTYRMKRRYTLTVIDANPSSCIPERLLKTLPYVSPGREYYAEGLKHYTFTLYY